MEQEKPTRFYRKKHRELSNTYSRDIKIVDKCGFDADFEDFPNKKPFNKQTFKMVFNSIMERINWKIYDSETNTNQNTQ